MLILASVRLALAQTHDLVQCSGKHTNAQRAYDTLEKKTKGGGWTTKEGRGRNKASQLHAKRCPRMS